MTDRPIIFSAPMVRALLEGRKSQTRRVLNGKSGILAARSVLQRGAHWMGIEYDRAWPLSLPYAIGDRLWVREAFNQFLFSQDGDDAWPSGTLVGPAEVREIAEDGCRVSPPQLVYRESDRARKWFSGQRWRPSIHMPRWASRLTLIVTDVRVQRLQEISAEDSLAEGVQCGTCEAMNQSACHGRGCFASIDAFRSLWNSLHGPDAWAANPWVAALTFRVIRDNIDSPEAAQ